MATAIHPLLYSPQAFSRQDEGEDLAFYRVDRFVPHLDSLAPFDPERVAQRRRTIARTLTCPYCDSGLRKWAVPQTPFTEYDAEFLYLCFDDRCPFLVSGGTP